MSDLVERAEHRTEQMIRILRQRVANPLLYTSDKPSEEDVIRVNAQNTQDIANLNSWLAHDKDFKEHKNRYIPEFEGSFWRCKSCGDEDMLDYPCSFIVSKSKILLGEE